MACRTPSVDRVAGTFAETINGKIAELEKTLQSKDDKLKEEFFRRIDSGFNDANISDARQIGYNSYIKAEMVSEFNLDAIAGVITSALDTAKTILGSPASADAVAAGVTSPLLTPAALDSYKGLVTSVAAAARSSFKAAGSVSFSMNRISTGVYAFLYATSMNLEDKETFGTETISITTIYYRIMQSIQDVQMQGAFDAVFFDKDNYLKAKGIQAKLMDKLSNDLITIDQWMALDEKLELVVERAKKRLDDAAFKSTSRVAMAADSLSSKSDQQLVQASIKKLAANGVTHKIAIETSQKRLADAYF